MYPYLFFFYFFFFNDTATTEIYTLSLHDALPIWPSGAGVGHVPKRSSGKPPPAGSASDGRSSSCGQPLEGEMVRVAPRYHSGTLGRPSPWAMRCSAVNSGALARLRSMPSYTLPGRVG